VRRRLVPLLVLPLLLLLPLLNSSSSKVCLDLLRQQQEVWALP
jgi:hypothetical protein